MLAAALVRRRGHSPSGGRSIIALMQDGGFISTRLAEQLPATALALGFFNQVAVLPLSLQLRVLPSEPQAAGELAVISSQLWLI